MNFKGFSYDEIVSKLDEKSIKYITGEKIKDHSAKKIEYMKKYVEQWLYVLSNVSEKIFLLM